MTKIEASVMIDRPVEEVWKFITDLSLSPKWNAGLLEVKQTSAGPLGMGTTLQSSRSTRPHLATDLVKEYELGRRFIAEVTSPQMIKGTRESLTLENVEGKTKLNSAWELKFNGFYRLVGPLLFGGVRRANEVRINKVKRILESEAQTVPIH
jgi:hypothetical protein